MIKQRFYFSVLQNPSDLLNTRSRCSQLQVPAGECLWFVGGKSSYAQFEGTNCSCGICFRYLHSHGLARDYNSTAVRVEVFCRLEREPYDNAEAIWRRSKRLTRPGTRMKE